MLITFHLNTKDALNCHLQSPGNVERFEGEKFSSQDWKIQHLIFHILLAAAKPEMAAIAIKDLICMASGFDL